MSSRGKETTYFSGLADQYARFRPSYCAAAIRAIVDGVPEPRRIADIGCGTGISTRLLAREGAEVVFGLEPNEGMLDRARRTPVEEGAAAARIEYRNATADATTLASDSIDIVVCAQSFHWFDNESSVREFHRVLRIGGRLALMWNVRTLVSAADREHESLMRRLQDEAAERGLVVRPYRAAGLDAYRAWFVNPRLLSFDNPLSLSLDELIGRAKSASYFPRDSERAQAVEAELANLFARHARDGRLLLAQVTEVTLADSTKAARSG